MLSYNDHDVPAQISNLLRVPNSEAIIYTYIYCNLATDLEQEKNNLYEIDIEKN